MESPEGEVDEPVGPRAPRLQEEQNALPRSEAGGAVDLEAPPARHMSAQDAEAERSTPRHPLEPSLHLDGDLRPGRPRVRCRADPDAVVDREHPSNDDERRLCHQLLVRDPHEGEGGQGGGEEQRGENERGAPPWPRERLQGRADAARHEGHWP